LGGEETKPLKKKKKRGKRKVAQLRFTVVGSQCTVGFRKIDLSIIIYNFLSALFFLFLFSIHVLRYVSLDVLEIIHKSSFKSDDICWVVVSVAS
jgi:hypothetical protein